MVVCHVSDGGFEQGGLATLLSRDGVPVNDVGDRSPGASSRFTARGLSCDREQYRGGEPASTFAADSVPLTVEPVGIARHDGEDRVRNVAAVQVRWRRGDVHAR
jgi:hypothetical protein